MNWKGVLGAALLGTVLLLLAISCGSDNSGDNGGGNGSGNGNGGYTVTFVTNGGNSVNDIKGVVINVEPIPTRSGQIFGGWYDNAGLTGKITAFPYQVTKDITLYARWVAQPGYKVTFDTDGGYLTEMSLTGVAYIAKMPIPHKDDHVLVGWTTDKGVDVTFPYAVTEDITLRAILLYVDPGC